MTDDLTWVQGSLGLADVPEEIQKIKRRRALPVKKCQLCKKDVLMPFLSGSSDSVHYVGGQKVISGLQLKLDPEPVEGGDYFIIGKIAHRRREEDRHPSILFYVSHDCVAE